MKIVYNIVTEYLVVKKNDILGVEGKEKRINCFLFKCINNMKAQSNHPTTLRLTHVKKNKNI